MRGDKKIGLCNIIYSGIYIPKINHLIIVSGFVDIIAQNRRELSTVCKSTKNVKRILTPLCVCGIEPAPLQTRRFFIITAARRSALHEQGSDNGSDK